MIDSAAGREWLDGSVVMRGLDCRLRRTEMQRNGGRRAWRSGRDHFACYARFINHSPDNEALVRRVLVFNSNQPSTDQAVRELNTWSLVAIPLASCGIEPGPAGLAFPENPTSEQDAARALAEKVIAAVNAYDDATGDEFPMPRF